MGSLEKKEKELVAIGAAIVSNCIPCIIYHINEARRNGLSDEQIKEAIDLADSIRKVPADQIINTAYSHIEADSTPADDEKEDCCEDTNPCCHDI